MSNASSDLIDIAVIGAGPAGLLAACLMARSGATVAAFGPDAASAGDQRTTALFMGAVRLLQRIDLWPDVADAAAPLAVMRIVDRLTRTDHPSVILFEAQEIGPDPFGFNIPNTALLTALEAQVASQPRITRIVDTVETIEHTGDHLALTSADGSLVRARLVVAADGRGSPARAAAGIGARVWDYDQSALVTTLAHDKPHNSISTEVHRAGGPFTTVPLPGDRSAVLWLDKPANVDRLMELDQPALARHMEDELDGFLGAVSIDGPRGVFPIRGLAVEAIAAKRTALVGEAAHVVPPIGAQGLNLGFRDVATLAELVGGALARGADPGAPALLGDYTSARWRDIASRQTASDLLNRSLLIDLGAVRGARGIGLALIAGLGPVRRRLIRDGLVRERNLPQLMRS